MSKRNKETRKQLIVKYRKELGDDLNETYTGLCVIHGEFENTFKSFLNKPFGCKHCIKNDELPVWDKDFNESLIWLAIPKLIADKKLAARQAEMTDEN